MTNNKKSPELIQLLITDFIYTNKDRNEFAIGLKEDETFRAMKKYVNFI